MKFTSSFHSAFHPIISIQVALEHWFRPRIPMLTKKIEVAIQEAVVRRYNDGILASFTDLTIWLICSFVSTELCRVKDSCSLVGFTSMWRGSFCRLMAYSSDDGPPPTACWDCHMWFHVNKTYPINFIFNNVWSNKTIELNYGLIFALNILIICTSNMISRHWIIVELITQDFSFALNKMSKSKAVDLPFERSL